MTVLTGVMIGGIVLILAYIYQSYVVWAIVNMLMYFQILQMEKDEKREMKALKKERELNNSRAGLKNKSVDF